MLGMIGASKISFLIRDVLWGGKEFYSTTDERGELKHKA